MITSPPPAWTCRDWSWLLAAVALCFLAFGLTLRNDFVFDDHYYVAANPWIRSWQNLWPLVSTYKTNSQKVFVEGAFWRPFRNIAFLVDYTIAGGRPAWYHFMNLVWHALTVAGVYTLIRRLGIGATSAFIGAAIFAIHPVQSESVAWIKERDGLMSGAFLAWSLVCAVGGCWRGAAASLALCACSLLSKETGVLYVPFVVAVLWAARHRGVLPADRRRWALLAGGGLILVGIYMFVRSVVLGQVAQTTDLMGGTYPRTLWTMCGVFLRYIGLVVYPLNMQLFYHYIQPATWRSPLPIVGVIVMLALVYTVWRFRCRRPMLSLGLFLFMVGLLPFSNILPMVQWMATRFLYIPMMGIAVLFAAGYETIERQSSRSAPFLAGALLSVYTIVSIFRCFLWQSDLTLWRDNYLSNPENVPAAMSYIDALFEAGEYEESLKLLEKFPFFEEPGADYSPIPWRVRIGSLANLGRIGEAEQVAGDARRHFPDDWSILSASAYVYTVGTPRLEKAIPFWLQIVEKFPFNLTTWRNLQQAYAATGQQERSEQVRIWLDLLATTPRSDWESIRSRAPIISDEAAGK